METIIYLLIGLVVGYIYHYFYAEKLEQEYDSPIFFAILLGLLWPVSLVFSFVIYFLKKLLIKFFPK